MQRFRMALTGLAAAAALLIPTGMAQAASVQSNTDNPLGTYYVCDGGGSGSCMSLVPQSGPPGKGEAVNAYGEAAGAWRWDVLVTSAGDYIFQLHAYNTFCDRNSAGGDVVNICDDSAADQLWEWNSSGWLINVGRTHDKGTTEVLCNPGGGGQLVIVPPSYCSAYHEDWGLS